MTGIYATNALTFFVIGLTAIPIFPKSKRPEPSIANWSGYCDNLPRPELQRQWLEKHGDCGIGVCTGREVRPGLRFAAVDIDMDLWVAPIRALFDSPASAKKGKKGQTFFVLAEKGLKSTSLRDFENTQIVDVLIGGHQTVIPPTIHPDTGRPYEWVGKALTDVPFDDLPILTTERLATLKALVESEDAACLLYAGDPDA